MVSFDWNKYFEEFKSWLEIKGLTKTYWNGSDEKNNNLIRLTFIREKHPSVYEETVSNMRAYTKLKNETLKNKFIELLGGQCQECGFKKYLVALQFHHPNPADKWSKTTGSGYNEDPERFEEDIKQGKIQLLCANCHWYNISQTKKHHRTNFKYQEIKKELAQEGDK